MFKAKVVSLKKKVGNPTGCSSTCGCYYCEQNRWKRVIELRVIGGSLRSFMHKRTEKGRKKGTPYVLATSENYSWYSLNTMARSINNGTYEWTEQQYKEMMECFSPGSTNVNEEK